MYLCYIDESGTPELPGNSSHFVLACAARQKEPGSAWQDEPDRETGAVARVVRTDFPSR